MTGMRTLESGHDALRRQQLLADDGRIKDFMQQTDFYRMRSRDELAAGSTKWVLADPGPEKSYIAYTYEYAGPMGVKGMTAGRYDLIWFDTMNGRTFPQNGVSVPAGDVTWTKPDSIGTEIALYVKRAAE